MSVDAIDIEYLRSWIGREETVSDIVSEDLAQKYHGTFDLQGEPPKNGEIVPRLIHFCLAQTAVPTARLGSDGHPARGGFLPPVPLPRRMWAGSSLTFDGDLKVGDRTIRTSRIEEVVLKQGSTSPLCFVTVRHRIKSNGLFVVEEQQNIVYRGFGPRSSTPTAQILPEQAVHHRAMKVEPVLLFRYSALTFNGHRIHYDQRYARRVEGYPGLIVHGPMQAALLCNYATELRGSPPMHFSFRSVAPLFDGEAFALKASGNDKVLKLWTAKRDGPACMAADASWE